ncbi:glycoside hydrolase family 3 N-terminal domain-containing protein [uncultured Ruminococcus sp.]|uniref:glycoside hydrolase family 3 N-terminal domain-containing protein n=1 Tax=uncultured Ruminococcus sp. TaxID=165186 RepID=UPI0025CBB548|nr:glycoside hydrolase family 3 N-terminal domain-containing protein [uncultured Ruminococcus sp.]
MYKKISAVLCAAILAAQTFTVNAEDVAKKVSKGDLTGDGMINVTDISKLAAHVKGVKALDGDIKSAADLNGDGDINVTDISILAAHIKGIRTIDGKDSTPIPEYKTKAEEKLAEMTLHEKVCQMFIVTPDALAGEYPMTFADSYLDNSLSRYPVGGFIFFAENLTSESQTKAFINDTQAMSSKYSDIPLFFSVDEEGGTVARCAQKLGTTAFYNMYTYKDYGTQTAYKNAWTIANDLDSLGFNLDFAPVADTWSNYNNTVIGWRAYSDNFSQTAELISYAVKGFRDGGVACTLKHFPGHGDTEADSHLGMACSYKTISQLETQEYLAFESGIAAGADMVMVGHITMSNIDGLPASISPTMVNGELRGKLGYDGVVITDGLGMGAVANYYGSAELAVKCVQAGDDILLIPADLPSAVKGIEDAVKNGTLTEKRIDESVLRILSLKEKRGMLK